MTMKSVWVSYGDTGRMRNPDWARSEEDVKKSAEELGRTLAYLLTQQPGSIMNAHLHLWYNIRTVRDFLKDAEDKLLDDLFQLGVYVPEKFDVRELKKFKAKKKITARKKK